MTQQLVSRLLVGTMLVLPFVASASPATQDFRPPQKRVDVPQPPAGANLSITMPQAGDQLARLHFSSDSKTVEATAQRIEVTYTKEGLTVEMASGNLRYTQTVSPWQTRSNGEFKKLTLSFGSNGELVSVQPEWVGLAPAR